MVGADRDRTRDPATIKPTVKHYAMRPPLIANLMQITSVTVKMVGIGKCVSVTNCHSIADFQHNEVLFEKNPVTVADCHCNRCHCN